MSLSGLMTALAEYVGDRLVNDCGAPAPDRVLRYHGDLPDDCCSEAGTLSVSWTDGRGSNSFPVSAATGRNDAECGLLPVYTLTIRYKICWPVPEVNDEGVAVNDAQDGAWDAASAQLADATDCITHELLSLQCLLSRPLSALMDDYERAVADHVARQGWFRVLDVAPSLPLGGCAGVRWRVNAAPIVGAVS